MRFPLFVCVSAMCASLPLSMLEAAEPSIPENPKSEDACQQWSSAFQGYWQDQLNEIRARDARCKSHFKGHYSIVHTLCVNTSGQVTHQNPCDEANYYSQCATISQEKGMRACLARVANYRDRDGKNGLSRRVLLDSVTGTKNFAISNARRLGRLALEQDERKRDRLKQYLGFARAVQVVNQIRAAADPKISAEKRVEMIGKIGESTISYTNKKNPLSVHLTKLAMRGAIAANQNAMRSLTRQLDQFSSHIKRNEDASIKAKRDANERVIQEAIAKTKKASELRWAAVAIWPSNVAFGLSWNHTSQANAEDEALSQCGGGACRIAGSFTKGCMAVASCRNGPNGGKHGIWVGDGETRDEAIEDSIQACRNHSSPDCIILNSVCQ